MPPSPKKAEVYSGPSKYELVLQLKKYNAAHEGSSKLPIPSLSHQSKLKVEILEAQEKKLKDAQNAQKEATKLIKDLLAVERCINEGEDLELDWNGISKKCKSLMALLEKREQEKESFADRGLGSIQVQKKSKLDAKPAQASNQAVHVHNYKQVSSSSDIGSRLYAHSHIEDAPQRTKRWQEQVHEAAGIPEASKFQLYAKPKVEINDKNHNKHTVKEDMGNRITDQLDKERQDAIKREHFLRELDTEKQYQKKHQERKEKKRKERQEAESRMWKQEREKARLRREAGKKEQVRLEKQEMAKPYHSRSRSGFDEYAEATRLYHPANHIPARRSRSSDPSDSQNASESKPKTSTPKPQPESPEVRFTPSTKRDDHDNPSKNCTSFPKWFSSKPKRSPILGKNTEEEKEKELKRRREVAERLHSEVRKYA